MNPAAQLIPETRVFGPSRHRVCERSGNEIEEREREIDTL
jgi:hypothetical protein